MPRPAAPAGSRPATLTVGAELDERALAIREKALGPEHPDVAISLIGLAEVALARARPDDALPLAERAVRLHSASGVAPKSLAKARFVLARALVAHGDATTRGIELAQQARDVLRDAGPAHARDLAEVDAFLRAHHTAR